MRKEKEIRSEFEIAKELYSDFEIAEHSRAEYWRGVRNALMWVLYSGLPEITSEKNWPNVIEEERK